jgi:AcrR family transcriptional regulator
VSLLAAKSTASMQALLGVARSAFGANGYAATSLDAIAAEARMTKGAVYHHFGGKEALFEAVFRQEHRRMLEIVVAKSRGAADPIESLLRGMRAYLKAIIDPVARRILLEDGPSVLGWQRWRTCEEPGFQQLLEGSLARAAKLGLLRHGVRPSPSAVLLLGAMTEAALSVAHSDSAAAASRQLGDEIAVLVESLRSSE